MNGLLQLCLTICLTLLISNEAKANEDTKLPNHIVANGVEFILIPAGWFSYTVPNGERYRALPEGVPEYRHLRIWLDAFYMAEYEATAQDLARFMNAQEVSTKLKQQHVYSWSHGGEAEKRTGFGCTLHQDAQGQFIPADNQRRLPATYLSWHQADTFARWMGFRLPTDAEWQKAARGSDQRIWPWGDQYPDDTFALFSFGRECSPAEVTLYPKGRSPFGLYNMVGNVSEHVADTYNHSYRTSLRNGDRNPLSKSAQTDQPTLRMRYGGSWSSDPHSFPIAYRRYNDADKASNRFGVRFAVDTEEIRTLLAQGRAMIFTTELKNRP